MRKEITVRLSPREAANSDSYSIIAARELGIKPSEISNTKIIKRSIDARQKDIKVILKLLVIINEESNFPKSSYKYQDVSEKQEVVIIGSGPAGLFAALRLIELGYKPLILERGKNVQNRRRDIALLNRNENFLPESNFCFGEGGAGTFSDGKLYTRSNKRGDTKKILDVFHFHGAHDSILYEAHPHIGTNKLPGIIENIRKTIIDHGGRIFFETKVVNLLLKNNCLVGVVTNNNNVIETKRVILATGHSARDIYELLHLKQIALEAKGFAMGVRVEHPQELIDQIQYHCQAGRGEYLPAASYNLLSQIDNRGVYSFCMCPGGVIVPATTSTNEIVVNGMSPSERNLAFANSGIVVEIRLEDIPNAKQNPLAGLDYQKHLEQLAYDNVSKGVCAPAQRLLDFTQGKFSETLPKSSYHPGLVSSPLHRWLPQEIRTRLQEAFQVFGKKKHGFLTNEAVVVGVESRTSSPIRIPRNPQTFEHIQIKGLFPCGEGAGYAGGIVSSAMDGELCAEKVASRLSKSGL